MNLAVKDIRYSLGRFALTALGIGMLLMIAMGSCFIPSSASIAASRFAWPFSVWIGPPIGVIGCR